MADGVEAGKDKFRVRFADAEDKHPTSYRVVEMNHTQPFGKAITKFCQVTNKIVSDYKFTFLSRDEVSMTDTPAGLEMTQNVTIKYTRQVAYVHVKVPYDIQINGFKLITKLRHTFKNSLAKLCKLKELKDVYKYTYQSGEDVLENDSPITKGMGHNEHITIVCTRVCEPNFSTPIPKHRKTRSGREY
jgi:hypothetical protein